MNKIKLIVIEGHDRTGKGELMRSLKNDDRFFIYEQPETEEQDTDYKDPSKFEPFMIKWIRKVLDDLYTIHREDPDKIIIMTRLIFTDDVFSKIYNRKPIVRNYYAREIATNFDIYTIFMYWFTYQDYINRMKKIGEHVEFDKSELSDIYNLYQLCIKEYCQWQKEPNDFNEIYIKDEMTPEDILNWFNLIFDEKISKYFERV